MENSAAKMKEIVGDCPFVSVFVAARNEEENLLLCLRALQQQNYPGQWEVLLADDHSADRTLVLAKEFAQNQERFSVFSVPDPTSEVQGKALALALLAEKARGDIFLVCDADMQMPSGWISAMVSAIKECGAEMVNGTTATAGDTVFSALQAIDWLMPQGTFAWLSQLGISYTAMGNNMGITRQAYEATGGYHRLPFSLTEDFELFRHARAKGYRLIHLYSSKVFGTTSPQKSPANWLEQHVRWMIGFMQLPFQQQLVFYLQLLFYPLLVASFFLPHGILSTTLLSLWSLKILYNAGLLVQVRQFHLLVWLPLYELLFWPAYSWCLLRYLSSSKIHWKGRVWKKA